MIEFNTFGRIFHLDESVKIQHIYSIVIENILLWSSRSKNSPWSRFGRNAARSNLIKSNNYFCSEELCIRVCISFFPFLFSTQNQVPQIMSDISYKSPFSRDLNQFKKFPKLFCSVEKNRFEFSVFHLISSK